MNDPFRPCRKGRSGNESEDLRHDKKTESKTGVSRQKAQESQNGIAILAFFPLLRGYSFNVNPFDRFGVQAVKPSQTDTLGQTDGQIVWKHLKMNSLQNNRCSGRSNPVKVNQSDSFRLILAYSGLFRLKKI